MKKSLASKLVVLDCLSCSPDLTLCDYYLFPELKISMKGTHYDSIHGDPSGYGESASDDSDRGPPEVNPFTD